MWKYLIIMGIFIFGIIYGMKYVMNQINHSTIKLHAEAAAPANELRTMTFNTLSPDGVLKHADELAQFIKDHNLDIIGFQESGSFDKLSAALTKVNYPMFVMQAAYLGGKRMGIYSKYPLSNQSTFPFMGDRVMLKAQADTPFGSFQVYNMHPPQGAQVVCDALSILLSQTAPNPPQAIVFGDFNLDFNSPYTQSHCAATNQVNDLFDRSCSVYTNCRGNGLDNKGNVKYGIIDWVLVKKNAGLTIVESQRLNGSDGPGISFSDHNPTYARIVFDPAATPAPSATAAATPTSPFSTSTPAPTVPTSTPKPTWITYATPTCAPPSSPTLDQSLGGIKRMKLDTNLENVLIYWVPNSEVTMQVTVYSGGAPVFTTESQPYASHINATISNSVSSPLSVRVQVKNKCNQVGPPLEQTLSPIPTKPPSTYVTYTPAPNKSPSRSLLIGGVMILVILITVGVVVGA